MLFCMLVKIAQTFYFPSPLNVHICCYCGFIFIVVVALGAERTKNIWGSLSFRSTVWGVFRRHHNSGGFELQILEMMGMNMLNAFDAMSVLAVVL